MRLRFELVLAAFVIVANGCSFMSDSERYLDELYSKKLEIPFDIGHDSSKLIILNYIDSLGCSRCKSQYPLWAAFNLELNELTSNEVKIFFISPTQKAFQENSNMNCYVDHGDVFRKLNKIPLDSRFNTFLVDEEHRILLVGNPVRS